MTQPLHHDGKKIASLHTGRDPWRSGFATVTARTQVQLTSFGGPSTNRPRWSPDGQLIVFYSDAKGSRDIYLIRPDGGVPKQLVANPSTDTNPSWSADGKWIYFSSDRSGRAQLWKMPVDGGEAVTVWEIRGVFRGYPSQYHLKFSTNVKSAPPWCQASGQCDSERSTGFCSSLVTLLDNSRYSHAFALFHSRMTVMGANPRTSAVSSTLRPPK